MVLYSMIFQGYLEELNGNFMGTADGNLMVSSWDF